VEGPGLVEGFGRARCSPSTARLIWIYLFRMASARAMEARSSRDERRDRREMRGEIVAR